MARYIVTCSLPDLNEEQLADLIDGAAVGEACAAGVAWLCGVISCDQRKLVCELEATDPGCLYAYAWRAGLAMERVTRVTAGARAMDSRPAALGLPAAIGLQT